MKKMILAAFIAVSTLSAFAANENVDPRVLETFNTEFNAAKEVKWVKTEVYYLATFEYNEKHLFAYFDMDGELLAVTRNLSPADLPLSLLRDLKINYSNYWISDLFEVARKNGTSYHVTLENGETKLMLKTTEAFRWETAGKVKKS